MRALFIGGTGTISTAASRRALEQGWELYLLNRGTHPERMPEGAKLLRADIGQADEAEKAIEGLHFDVVVDFIAFVPEQVKRDIGLFRGKTEQYIFISSASAYQKPLLHYKITESTPLYNPYWQYSRDKIACEELLTREYRETGFPVTIVRPSHTYDERSIPIAIHGKRGNFQTIDRMLKGKPVLLPGDGTSLWTITHTKDFAKGFVGLMGNASAVGEAVQITSDEALSWNRIYDSIGRALGVPVKRFYVSSHFLASCDDFFEGGMIGDKANTVVFDNSKLKRLVPGFRAEIPFDQGCREALSFILSHEECRPLDPAFDAFCDAVIEELSGAAERIRKRVDLG